MLPGNRQGEADHAAHGARKGTARRCHPEGTRLRKHSFVVADPGTDRKLVADMGKATVMSNVPGKSDITPTESETTSMVGNFPHGSREIPATSASVMESDRSAKARCHTADMHVAGKSDGSIVPKKRSNKTGTPAAEIVEGRESPEGKVARTLLTPDTEPDYASHRTADLRQVVSGS